MSDKPELELSSPLLLSKSSFNIIIFTTMTDITMGSTEVEYEITPWLSIGTTTFDLG